MKKNLNEELSRIKSMMGLITEQSSCEWENYKNGDGVSRPKITVNTNDNGVTVTYQGPETGVCIQHKNGSTSDSLHQTCGVTRKVVSKYLKDLYSRGTFVYPDLNGITMSKSDNFLQITIPFVKTTEDKAITNFNERGGWGHTGDDTAKEFETSISDPSKYTMVNKIQKVASGGKSADITETWFSFRDIVTYPIKTIGGGGNEQNQQPQQEKGEMRSLSFSAPKDIAQINKIFKTYIRETLEEDLTYKVNKFTLTVNGDKVNGTISITPTAGKNTFKFFSVVFNPKGSPALSKDKATDQSINPGAGVVPGMEGDFDLGGGNVFEYHLIGLQQ
jgi:hypothetical protein